MSRQSRRVWAVGLGIVALSVGLSVLARLALGARGELVPSLLLVLYPAGVAGYIGRRWLRGASDRRMSASNRRVIGIMALAPLAFAAFFAWQGVLLALDLALPFDTVTVDVIGTRYTPSGRGPGTEHLYTADGTVYSFPLFVYPNSDLTGLRTITLSRFERLVIEVR